MERERENRNFTLQQTAATGNKLMYELLRVCDGRGKRVVIIRASQKGNKDSLDTYHY